MHREITPRELRRESNQVIRELDKGPTFVATHEGGPVGELKPMSKSSYISTETAVELFHSLPPIDYERFRADVGAVADQDPTPLA